MVAGRWRNRDQASRAPLTDAERDALPRAIGRPPLWGTGGWVASPGDQHTARAYAHATFPAIGRARAAGRQHPLLAGRPHRGLLRAAGEDGPARRCGQTGWVRVVVTQIGWEGRMRRRALDTSGLTDAGRWENLIEQVLASPPPYRAAPGRPVYVIHAGDRAVLVAEQDLTGPLAGLVKTILETGERPLAAERADSCRSDRDDPSDAAPS